MPSDYETLLANLQRSQRMKIGLSGMLHVDQLFGFPSKQYKSIHVAGTNGKGSVCTKIAHTLTDMGYKTGLFTSPHITTFRERLQIDGQMISKEEIEMLLEEVLEKIDTLTFFEMLTLLAFLYFSRNKVDYAVFETGIGGSYDATNIIQPSLSVITSISYDHMHILGTTLDEIAENKAGIIKAETPVVLGNRAARKPCIKKAFELLSPIIFVPPIEDPNEENSRIASQAVSTLLPLSRYTLSSKGPPCRFELNTTPYGEFLFDIAHNPDGLQRLFKWIGKHFPDRTISLILGLSYNRNMEEMVDIIKSHTENICPFTSSNEMAVSMEVLLQVCKMPSPIDVIDFVEKASRENHLIVVTGSTYIMNSVKKLFSVSGYKEERVATPTDYH